MNDALVDDLDGRVVVRLRVLELVAGDVPVRKGAFVLVAITYGRIPTYPFWPRPGHSATDRLGPEPIGRRSPLREYEVLYIVRADLDDEKVQDAVKRVNTLIERSGGSVERTNLWGKRKLAYEVKHQKEGSYVLQDFQFEPNRVPELEAALKITEEVLRHLIVRKPEKAAPATVVAPPPAEVVLEPIAAESDAVAEPVARAEEES
jgi:small subunit ribosomal protein S6